MASVIVAPSTQQQEGPSIAAKVKECLSRFDALLADVEAKDEYRSLSGRFSDAYGRFKIWSSNIGAHRTGRRSLDHRLRDASHLLEHVLNLLSSLAGCLSDAREISSGTRVPWDQLQFSDSDSDDSDDEDDAQNDATVSQEFQYKTEMDQILASINEGITNLLRLSASIRNPARHDQWLNFSKSFDTTPFEKYDIGHVVAKYPNASDELAHRLGTALSRRRCYFKYREEHRNKMAAGLTVEEKEQDGKSTIASSLPDKHKMSAVGVSILRDDDDQSESGFTATSFATSVADTAATRVPPLPPGADYDKLFECPFCFDIVTVKNRTAWKQHVYVDLQPYMCLRESCSLGRRMYSTRHEWLLHEQDHHSKTWACCLGCPDSFYDCASMRNHYLSHHSVQTRNQIDKVLEASETRRLQTGPYPCALCLTIVSTTKAYGKHVGRHLRELSLFVLPVYAADEVLPDDDSENESRRESLIASDSSDEESKGFQQREENLPQEASTNSLRKEYPAQQQAILDGGVDPEGIVEYDLPDDRRRELEQLQHSYDTGATEDDKPDEDLLRIRRVIEESLRRWDEDLGRKTAEFIRTQRLLIETDANRKGRRANDAALTDLFNKHSMDDGNEREEPDPGLPPNSRRADHANDYFEPKAANATSSAQGLGFSELANAHSEGIRQFEDAETSRPPLSLSSAPLAPAEASNDDEQGQIGSNIHHQGGLRSAPLSSGSQPPRVSDTRQNSVPNPTPPNLRTYLGQDRDFPMLQGRDPDPQTHPEAAAQAETPVSMPSRNPVGIGARPLALNQEWQARFNSLLEKSLTPGAGDTLLATADITPQPPNNDAFEDFDTEPDIRVLGAGAKRQRRENEEEDTLSHTRSPVSELTIKRGITPLHIPAHARQWRSRGLSETIANDNLGEFSYKNLPDLEEANKEVIQRLRAEAMQSQDKSGSVVQTHGVKSASPSLESRLANRKESQHKPNLTIETESPEGSYYSRGEMETPISPLPSRFVENTLLPSPSSFYPEWGFGRESNMLPSPLTFQPTPIDPSEPSFGRDEPADRKRKASGEGLLEAQRSREKENLDEDPSKPVPLLPSFLYEDSMMNSATITANNKTLEQRKEISTRNTTMLMEGQERTEKMLHELEEIRKELLEEQESPKQPVHFGFIGDHESEAAAKLPLEPQPMYVKVHKEHLDTETLDYYGLLWEWDKSDSDYIIILHELDARETEILFEHTRRLRSRDSVSQAKKAEESKIKAEADKFSTLEKLLIDHQQALINKEAAKKKAAADAAIAAAEAKKKGDEDKLDKLEKLILAQKDEQLKREEALTAARAAEKKEADEKIIKEAAETAAAAEAARKLLDAARAAREEAEAKAAKED